MKPASPFELVCNSLVGRATKHRARVITRIRSVSTTAHFYQNRQLELYASKETQRLTLRQLVRASM